MVCIFRTFFRHEILVNTNLHKAHDAINKLCCGGGGGHPRPRT